MNDVIKTAMDIKECMVEIDRLRGGMEALYNKKAKAESTYIKNLAIATVGLKNGDVKEWQGLEVGKVAATLIPNIAKGMNAQYWYEQEIAISAYKCNIIDLEAVKAKMYGHQNINKHLDTTGEPISPAF